MDQSRIKVAFLQCIGWVELVWHLHGSWDGLVSATSSGWLCVRRVCSRMGERPAVQDLPVRRRTSAIARTAIEAVASSAGRSNSAKCGLLERQRGNSDECICSSIRGCGLPSVANDDGGNMAVVWVAGMGRDVYIVGDGSLLPCITSFVFFFLLFLFLTRTSLFLRSMPRPAPAPLLPHPPTPPGLVFKLAHRSDADRPLRVGCWKRSRTRRRFSLFCAERRQLHNGIYFSRGPIASRP